MGRYMLTPYIEIEAEGSPLNPYSENDENFGSFTDSILVSLKLGPEYTYENDINRIRFRLKKKPLGQIATLVLVILSDLLIGAAGMLLFPENLRENLLNAMINPVYNAFFDVLGCIAGPMIFLSVAWGVYGIGDAATLGRIGRKMMLRYVGTTILVCACGTVFFPLLVSGRSGG